MEKESALLSESGGGSIQEFRGLYQQQFMDRFLELENVGVLIVDEECRIVEISRMLCALFKCERVQVIGLWIEDWFKLVSMKQPPFDRTLMEGVSFRDRLLKWKGDEQEYELIMDGEVLIDNNKPNGAFILFRNASHLMTLEEQIRRSDRLKMIGQIAAGTAHEIRNPLTAIKGFMQLLNKTLDEHHMSREQEFVAIVLSELERINELVSEFLLLSKPREAKLVPIRIGHILQEILPIIRNEAILHNVTVVYIPNPELPPILTDKELMKQVFLNLGKNAIEAMEGGGTLIIQEHHHWNQAQGIAIEVKDTGVGIPKQQLDRVFDPFFTTKAQGTGLGLSVCQRIVHDMGGNIDVSSDQAGTRFTIGLPYLVEENE